MNLRESVLDKGDKVNMQYYIDDNETINGARQVEPNDKHAEYTCV